MRITLLSSIFIIIYFTSCENRMCLPEYFDWVYYNQEMIDNRWTGHLCEYQIQIKDSLIYAKSLCSKHCDVISSKGAVIDTAIYDSIPFVINMQYTGGEKMYVWDTWNYEVEFSNKSRVTKLSYTTSPTESVKFLSRRRPEREHSINFVLDGKTHTAKLPTKRGYVSIYNICQYDETRFLFSMRLGIEDIVYNREHYYVTMIDLEDLSRKRFLGIKL